MTVGPLTVSDLVVEFVHDGYAIRPLDGLSFEAQAGELVVLLGPSGCGKTTLLSCLGGILTPTSGTIRMGDVDVTSMKGKQLDAYRRETIGFVFQAFNLIPSLTARENIAVPLTLTGHGRKESFARADELLEQVGLAERAHHLPSKLSGGQMQRVAVARGLGHNPPLLLADEPTANLDHIQAEAIIRLLQTLRDDGRMIVVSTHDSRLVPIADRIVQMVPPDQHEERPTHDVTFGAGDVDLRTGRSGRPGVRDQVGQRRRDPGARRRWRGAAHQARPRSVLRRTRPVPRLPSLGLGARHERRRVDRLQPPRVPREGPPQDLTRPGAI